LSETVWPAALRSRYPLRDASMRGISNSVACAKFVRGVEPK
jgi:hypothetical protein